MYAETNKEAKTHRQRWRQRETGRHINRERQVDTQTERKPRRQSETGRQTNR